MNIPTTITTQDFAKTVHTMSRTGKLLFGGLTAAVLASFLPWATVTYSGGDSYDMTPSDAQLLAKIMVVVATTVWAAWPVVAGTFSKKRFIGLTAAVCVLSLFPLVNAAQIVQTNSSAADRASANPFGFDDAAKYSVAFGLLMFAAAMIPLWMGVVGVWRGRRAARLAPTPASFPPPQVPAVTSAM